MEYEDDDLHEPPPADDEDDDDLIAPPDLPDDDDDDGGLPLHLRGALPPLSFKGNPLQVQDPTLAAATGMNNRARTRRPRQQHSWATSQGAGDASGGVVPDGAAGDEGLPIVAMPKQLHNVQQALRYRLLMKPDAAPPQGAERQHLTALLQSFFQQHGFHKSAEALHHAGAAASGLPPAASRALHHGPALDLPRHVAAAADAASTLFDDEAAWPADAFFASELPFTTVEDRGKNMSCASVDRLIEKLVLEEADAPLPVDGPLDLHFTNVFLLMWSNFVCPDVLVSRMSKLFKTLSAHTSLLGDEKVSKWQCRVLSILQAWVSVARVDLTRTTVERLLSFAISNAQGATAGSSGAVSPVARLAGRLVTMLQNLGFDDGMKAANRWRIFPHLPQPPAAMDPAKPTFRGDTVLKHLSAVDDVEAAKQFSLLEFELFATVRVRELFNNAWSEPALSVLSANLNGLMQHMEHVTQWVASMIITPMAVKDRQAMYAKCIRVMAALFDMQNYATAYAFLNGVDHPSVTRLSDTVASTELPAKEVDSLQALKTAFDPFHGTLKNLPWNLATPCLPVMAPLVNEMQKNNEAFHTTLTHNGEKLVNWTKQIQCAKVCLRIVSYQRRPYPFQVDPVVRRLLQQMPLRRDTDTLYELSDERAANVRSAY